MDVGTATLGSFADYNGSPMSIPPVQVEVHAETLANEDFAGLCASVRSLRRGRSVPEWSAPAEVWRLLLFPAEHLSHGHNLPPGTHGSCEGLLRTLLYLVRRNQEVPWLWNLSSPVELDKSNGKRGCAGKRLIHKLDPIGKSFFSHAMDSARRCCQTLCMRLFAPQTQGAGNTATTVSQLEIAENWPEPG